MEKLIKEIPQSAKKYKPSAPFTAKLLEKKIINNVSGKDQVAHLVLDLTNSDISFLEGQSIGVVPPGQREDGRPNKVRLYSIASARSGELSDKNSVALSVKRLVIDQEDESEKYGLCSDYLCNLKAGSELQITGPTGRGMLLPQKNDQDLILIATGTGVAPYRAYLQHISRTRANYRGRILIYLGYKRQTEALYCNSINDDMLQFAKSCDAKLSIALSREQKNKSGGKMYVADLLEQDQEILKSVWAAKNYSVYICGLKGMEEAIESFFAKLTSNQGEDWQALRKELPRLGRWNLEVY